MACGYLLQKELRGQMGTLCDIRITRRLRPDWLYTAWT